MWPSIVFPARLRDGTTVRLERVGDALSKGQPSADSRITDGAISTDGEWVVLRTRSDAVVLSCLRLSERQLPESPRGQICSRSVSRGERASPSARTVPVYVAGEGGGKSQPGTLAVLSCAN